jgi:uncharacterized membrane protein
MLLLSHIAKDGFRLRGVEMSRIDAFSDVVFGFALTLIVVSLQVPRTFQEMLNSVRGFVPFSICFLFLILLWHEHYRFFRRYGLQDALTVAINALLLFTLLFYLYPLKFLFTMLAAEVFNLPGLYPGIQSITELRQLMALYGAGFSAIYGIFGLLYANAWRQRRVLGLNALERTITIGAIVSESGMVAVGLIACLFAMVSPPHLIGYSGFIYFAAFPWRRFIKIVWGRKARRLRDLRLPSH